ncbi:Dynein light chain roadblock-type 2, partial [Micractinium conductrix]
MTHVAAVEETVKRLSSHKGVVGIAIVNGDGVPIRTTLDPELATTYAALVSQLALKARHMVRELAEDGSDDLQFLRVRSKKHEIMIAPGFDRDHNYTLLVVQQPDAEPSGISVRGVIDTTGIISAAVERYAELCGGAFSGQAVDRTQVIDSVQFFYSPPPRAAVPYAASLRATTSLQYPEAAPFTGGGSFLLSAFEQASTPFLYPAAPPAAAGVERFLVFGGAADAVLPAATPSVPLEQLHRQSSLGSMQVDGLLHRQLSGGGGQMDFSEVAHDCTNWTPAVFYDLMRLGTAQVQAVQARAKSQAAKEFVRMYNLQKASGMGLEVDPKILSAAERAGRLTPSVMAA